MTIKYLYVKTNEEIANISAIYVMEMEERDGLWHRNENGDLVPMYIEYRNEGKRSSILFPTWNPLANLSQAALLTYTFPAKGFRYKLESVMSSFKCTIIDDMKIIASVYSKTEEQARTYASILAVLKISGDDKWDLD